MCLEPVLTKAAIGYEGNGERERCLHLFDDDGLDTFFFFREDAEIEFIVYLQDHLASDAFGLEAVVNANHGHFDDIGSSTLNGGVDGVALGKAPHGGILRVDVR